VVRPERQLAGIRAEEAVLLEDEMSELQRPEAEADGVVEVAPGHVGSRPLRLEPGQKGEAPGLQLQFGKAPLRRRDEEGGHQRHREDGDDAAHGAHQLGGQLARPGDPLVLRKAARVETPRGAPAAQGDRRAEAHAGISEAVPAVRCEKKRVAPEEAEGRPRRRGQSLLGHLGFEVQEKRPVLQRPVEIDPDGNEDEVARTGRIERAEHVVEEAESRRPERAVA